MENRGARLVLELGIGFVLLGIILLPRWMNGPGPPAPAARPSIEHVVLVVLPRGAASEVLVRQAAARGVLLVSSHALAHPALPNRIALVSGGAWGVHAETTAPLAVKHVGDLLDVKRLPWRVCADDPALVPFEVFARKARVIPIADCGSVLVDDRRLSSAFTYVAARALPPLELPPHTLLIVTIDEGRGDTNDILTAIIGDGVRAGGVSRNWYDHYSVLRTIEELLHLGTLTAHDAKADVVDDIWR
jgi:hypothetical protein